MRRRTLTYHHPLPLRDALTRFGERGTLVVALYACSDIGVQIMPGQQRRVAVYGAMVSLRVRNLAQHIRISCQHAGIVHHLCQPKHAQLLIVWFQRLRAQDRAGFIERRRRNTGGQHHIYRERQALAHFKHIVDAVRAADVRDLVRVGDDRRRAMRQDSAGQLCRGEHRALDVHMAVDQARADIAAGGILHHVRIR